MTRCQCGAIIPIEWNYCDQCLAWLKMDDKCAAQTEESDRIESRLEREKER